MTEPLTVAASRTARGPVDTAINAAQKAWDFVTGPFQWIKNQVLDNTVAFMTGLSSGLLLFLIIPELL